APLTGDHPSLPATARSGRRHRLFAGNGERSLDRWNNFGRSDSAAAPDRTADVGFPSVFSWTLFPRARSSLHLSVETASARSCPAQPASIKGYSEMHSGDVNNDSGPRAICVPHPAGIRIHIAPESVFTISRNAYSHAPEYASGWSARSAAVSTGQAQEEPPESGCGR